jgi:hypothetical protein
MNGHVSGSGEQRCEYGNHGAGGLGQKQGDAIAGTQTVRDELKGEGLGLAVELVEGGDAPVLFDGRRVGPLPGGRAKPLVQQIAFMRGQG